jgi:tetratricopeptide (TPR) repeat protein
MNRETFGRISRAWITAAAIAAALTMAPQRHLNAQEAPVAPAEQARFDAQVAKLIGELGAQNYATREKAQNELKELGVRAFDALFEAQSHEDIEIALRAQHLLQSLDVDWSGGDKSAEVKRILRGYDDLEDIDRKSRMDRLAALESDEGVAALCRLVRYETSSQLSKQGALLVMNRPLPSDPAARQAQAQVIRQAIGRSRRDATVWLLTFAQTLEDEAGAVSRWAEIVAAEHERFNQAPLEPDRDIVRDLLRWNAGLLERLGRKDESKAVVQRSLDLLTDDRQKLLEAVDWLLEKSAYEEIEMIAARFAAVFSQSTLLTYRLAESQLKQGQQEKAAATAEAAFKIEADDLQLHLEAAWWLQDRGLFDWSEKEYRHVISLEAVGNPYDLYARFLLSEMLHDLGRDNVAAEALAPAVEAMDKDPAVARLLPRFNREPGGVRSRLHFFHSLHAAAQGDREKQKQQLREGVQHDPNDADVLIAMHRAPEADEAWRKETQDLIKSAADHFRGQIKELSAEYEQAPNEKDRDEIGRELASANNQFAWLVSNTEGDFDEALACSQKSLELRPDSSGYLDTLGRCYYAKGDFENAVKFQSRAVELEPHSMQIRRQLELFQNALAEKQAGKAPQPNP